MRSARAPAILDARPGVRAHRRLDCLDQQLLGQDDVGGVGIAKRSELAAAHQPEALVRGDDPGFFGWKRVFLAKLLEDGRRDRRLAAVGVDVLPAAGDQRPCRVEVSGKPFIARTGYTSPCGTSSDARCGMLTHPSGASVSS